MVDDLTRPERTSDSFRFVRLGAEGGGAGGAEGAILAAESTRRVYDEGGRLREVSLAHEF